MTLVSITKIERRIFRIRGQNVMLDRDLAELYKVQTKVLIQAVKRNKSRFPSDFMFQLNKDEFENLRSQFVTSSWGRQKMKKHHRKSIRLKNRDYAQNGAYFVTICTDNRKCLFGDIVNNQICLNKLGKIVCNEWIKMPMIRRNIKLDSFVVMPNHFHGVIVLNRDVGATRRVAPTLHGRPNGPASGSIGAIVGQFKSAVTKRINEIRKTPDTKIWQRNYHEHIVRNGNDLIRVQQYINENPLNWDNDRNNPKNWNGNPKPKRRIGFHEK